jgi:ABC-type multidrug transport system fused ATPase/permease subunit
MRFPRRRDEPAGPRESIWSLVRDPVFRKNFTFVRKHFWMYVLAILAQVGQTGIAVWIADLFRILVSAGLKLPETEMTRILVGLAALGLLRLGTTYVEAWIGSLLNESVVYAMRRELLGHIQRLPLSYHEGGHSSDSTNVIYRDLEIAKDFVVSDIQKIIALPISFAVASGYLFHLNPWLGLVGISVGPMQLLGNLVLKKQFKEALQKQRKLSRDVFFTIGETLQGIREVKSNQMEPMIDAKMEEIQSRGVRDNVVLSKISALRAIAREVPKEVGNVAGVAVGAFLAMHGQVEVGEVVAFLSLLDRLAAPFTTVAGIIGNLQRAVEGARRYYDVLSMAPEESRADGVRLGSEAPEIRFDSVSFAYTDERPTLEDVSFVVPPGSSLALVGPSGSGKSTVVKLLYRFYAPAAGSIHLGGVDVGALQLTSLRDRLALVSQEIFLFDATVAENIAAGRLGASQAEIERAADLAQASFIRELPDGFDSEIGERGIKLSHGQKQRLSIARAILRDASVLVLDEPTSALDVETEASFQRDLGQWAQHCTKIIIAHRLTTIRDCDYVLFLEGGRVVEFGPPGQLAAQSGRFRAYLDGQSALNW